MKNKRYFPLAFGWLIYVIGIFCALAMFTGIAIDAVVTENRVPWISIIVFVLLIYPIITLFGHITFKKTFINVQGDMRIFFKIQYPVKIYYEEIGKVDLVFKGTNSKCEDVNNLFNIPYIEIECKDYHRKRIWVKKYTRKQVNKMLKEIEKRSGVKSLHTANDYNFANKLK